SFTVAEKDLPVIRNQWQARGRLPVEVTVPDGGGQETGELVFIDNTVDAASGTVKMKAQFANAGRVLWPGSYAAVRVILDEQPGAVVVPAEAVEQGQDGDYVFVVDLTAMTVSRRLVEVDRRVGSEIVLKRGVEPGETVVTDGQLNLTEGAAVEIREPVREGL
ncbi:MAG: efflux RND transporter periplasmic adaptor subunit, partial [Negativicutes bacterium]|nr:efflux RND transporter periplasmic adaptor subunit [Negativicutes bacterium]